MNEALVLDYLRANEKKINLKGLAEDAGLSQRSLHAYVSGARGKRGLSDETVAALMQAIESLRPGWSAPPAQPGQLPDSPNS